MSFPLPCPSPSIVFGSHTDVGRRRANNEDYHYCGAMGRGTLLVVCDGVGGTKAGEVASRLAAEGLPVLLAEDLAHAGTATDRCASLNAAARELDRRVREAARQPGSSGMGATLSALWLEGRQASWVQVGDSRIYRLGGGELRQISRDQSPVGRMRAEGQLSEEEARSHPYRHMIDQCLGGTGPAVEPEAGQLEFEPGDVFLLCSDGLSDGLWDREIAQELAAVSAGRSPEVVAHTLVNRANLASGNDNITAVVALVEFATGASATATVKRAASSLLCSLRRPRRGPTP